MPKASVEVAAAEAMKEEEKAGEMPELLEAPSGEDWPFQISKVVAKQFKNKLAKWIQKTLKPL